MSNISAIWRLSSIVMAGLPIQSYGSYAQAFSENENFIFP
jgi:hypothetical protein